MGSSSLSRASQLIRGVGPTCASRRWSAGGIGAGRTVTDATAIRAAIESLLAAHSVASVMVATEDGDVLDVVPAPHDPWEADSLAEWAAGQVEGMADFRSRLGEKEFSLLYEPKDGDTRLNCHLQSVANHILLVMFKDRDCLGSVRKAAKEAAQRLEQILSAS
jgi:hypothetical protein